MIYVDEQWQPHLKLYTDEIELPDVPQNVLDAIREHYDSIGNP